MKILFLTFVVATCTAVPQGYGSGGGRGSTGVGCRKETKYVNDVTYEEVTEKVCKTVYNDVCEVQYRKKCEDYKDKVCREVYNDVCENKRRKDCRTVYETVREPYEEDECRDNYVKECEKHWSTNGYGEKVWVDNPNRCQNVKKTQCEKVVKYTNKKVPRQACEWITYPDCKKVPDQICEYVVKQNCKKVPYDDCKKVPSQKCRDEHRRIPRQGKKKVVVTVCDDGNKGGYANEQGILPRDSSSIVFH